jgi:1-deoxy-D-xylulose-5-phosphate reductoisomerase
VKRIALLGSTGSIGVSTLALAREFPDQFQISGMVAGQNLKLLAKQVKEFSPKCVAIKYEADVPKLRSLLGRAKTEILFGEAGAAAVASASDVDVVLAAIVGGAGLMPCLKGLLAGKEIALACGSCPSIASTARFFSVCRAINAPKSIKLF